MPRKTNLLGIILLLSAVLLGAYPATAAVPRVVVGEDFGHVY